MKADGLVFAVRRVEADYLLPAKFDDDLVVETTMEPGSGARLVVRQDVKRDGALLFSALVTIICMTTDGAVTRLPAAIRRSVH